MHRKKAGSAIVALMFMLAMIPAGFISSSAGQYTDYTYTVADEKAAVTAYTGAGGNVAIPASLGGYPVTAIMQSAFGDCTGLTSVTIPYGVTAIGDYAFDNCTGLTSATIPNSLTTIEEHSFSNCESVEIYCYENSYAHIFAENQAISHELICISASPDGPGCVFDYTNMYIYGLTENIASLGSYFNTETGYELSYTPTLNGLGTGTAVELNIESLAVKSYTIILFGDVNGSSTLTLVDALMTLQAAAGKITFTQVQNFAADLNKSDTATAIDALTMLQYSSGKINIDQRTGLSSIISEINGEAAISGEAKFGETLAADISGITPEEATLQYCWNRGAEVIGTDSTYIISAGDIGESITLTVLGYGDYRGYLQSPSIIPVKADAAAPAAPKLAARTRDSVSLISVDGQEFRINNGEWQTDTHFTGLNPDTLYYFYTRVKETETTSASSGSAALSVTTTLNAFDYLLFSGSGTVPLTMKTNFNIFGSIHTNSNFDSGLNNGYVMGAIEAVGTATAGSGVQYGSLTQNAAWVNIETPDFSSVIMQVEPAYPFGYDRIYENWEVKPVADYGTFVVPRDQNYMIRGDVDFKNGLIVRGKLVVYGDITVSGKIPVAYGYSNTGIAMPDNGLIFTKKRTIDQTLGGSISCNWSFQGSGCLFAERNISFINGFVYVTSGKTLSLYAQGETTGTADTAQGNIAMNFGGTDGYGMIYAPHGKVTIGGGTTTWHGNIIADTINTIPANICANDRELPYVLPQ